MEKSKIITSKYVAVSRENIFNWLVNNCLDDKDQINKLRVAAMPKWAHFEIEETL